MERLKQYRWQSEATPTRCEACAERDGKIYDEFELELAGKPPLHPHCKCKVVSVAVQTATPFDDMLKRLAELIKKAANNLSNIEIDNIVREWLKLIVDLTKNMAQPLKIIPEEVLSGDTLKIIKDVNDKYLIRYDSSQLSYIEVIRKAITEAQKGTPLVYAQEKIENFLKESAKYMELLALDFTEEYLNNYFEDIQSSVGQYYLTEAEKIKQFIGLVKTDAMFDLKSKKEWQYPYASTGDETVSVTMTAFMYYNGKLWSAEELGNYNFGYIGAAYGYSLFFLQVGGGLYQLKSDFPNVQWKNWSSFFDDPRDSKQIEDGYNQFVRDRLNEKYKAETENK